MTREEAVAVLKERISCAKYINEDYADMVDVKALEMAIKSLEAWEKLIKFAELEQENNGICRVHINDIKKFYKEIKNDR